MLLELCEVRAGLGFPVHSGAVGSVSKSVGMMMPVLGNGGSKINSGIDSVGPGQKEHGFRCHIRGKSASFYHGPYESQGKKDEVGSRFSRDWGDLSEDDMGTWPDYVAHR